MSRRAAFAALAALTLLALAAPAGSASSTQPPQLSFHVPAQAGGDLAAGSAQWAFLVVHQGTLGVGLDLPEGAAATTRTVLSARVAEPGNLLGSGATPARPVDSPMDVAPGEATVAFSGGRWASLFVVADRIEATLSGSARLEDVPAADALEPLLWPPPPGGTLPPFPHQPSADAAALVQNGPGASGSTGGAPPGPLHLEVTGLRRLEWHNATARCTMACPDGPSYQEWTVPGTSADRVELRNYTALDAPSGRATVDGLADAVVLGGGRLDVTVDGWARLPQALLEGCRDCGEGRTLRLDGDALAFRGLAPEASQPGRLHGRLEAPAALAALDEEPAFPLAAAAGAVAAGGGLAVALALALRALGVLRVRAPEPGFGHERRSGLYQLVAGEPGLTFREVERRLGWGNGVTRHHLDVLVAEGHIVARRHLNTVRYFENHGRFDHDWQAVVHRRDPDSRWLLEVLQERALTQGELVSLAGGRGWSRSATQRKLARLVADGLVATRPDGNGRRYALTPPPAEPFRWLGRRAPAPAPEAFAGPARPAGTAGP